MNQESFAMHRMAVALGVAAWLVAAAAPAHAEGPATTNAAPAAGKDFIDDARVFYRVAACGEGLAIPAALHAATVEKHCRVQTPRLERFRSRFVARAEPFFAKHRPPGPHDTVVYPFGGGDLVSALITFPEAREITTISLEHAGDPRRLATLSRRELAESLEAYRDSVNGLLRNHDSASENMRKLENGPIPGQLSYFIQALVIMGYEPVSLRFFRLEDDGSLHYYDQAELDALESETAKRKAQSWVNTDFSVAYSNMELGFRTRGAGADAPLRIHRHIAANLNNDRFAGSPLEKHLVAKGDVVAMTKAASYLLWSGYFTKIRKYLLAHMIYMISDSTGIPPRFVKKAGFTSKTFGRFAGPFLDDANPVYIEEFQKLWEDQPARKLSFRYGYPDSAGNYHLIITTRKKQKQR